MESYEWAFAILVTLFFVGMCSIFYGNYIEPHDETVKVYVDAELVFEGEESEIYYYDNCLTIYNGQHTQYCNKDIMVGYYPKEK